MDRETAEPFYAQPSNYWVAGCRRVETAEHVAGGEPRRVRVSGLLPQLQRPPAAEGQERVRGSERERERERKTNRERERASERERERGRERKIGRERESERKCGV